METQANAEQQNHKLRENIIPGRDNKYVCHYARNRTDQSLHLTFNTIRNQENITVLPWLIISSLTLVFSLVIARCFPICDLYLRLDVGSYCVAVRFCVLTVP